MKNRKKIIFTAVLFALFVLTACASGRSSQSSGQYSDYDPARNMDTNYTSSYQSGGVAVEETAAVKADEAGYGQEARDTSSVEDVNYAGSGEYKQKLIKTVDIDVSTKEYDKSVTDLNNYISKNNSYIEYSNTYNPQDNNSYPNNTRYSNYTIRVPQDKLEALVKDLETLGAVISKTENVEDISLQYSDIEAHKKALQIEEESLLNLLSKAESMDAIIALESRLSEIRYEKESYESSLRLYDNQVQYSTVTLNLNEVKEYDNSDEYSYWGRLKNSFASSIEGAGYFFGELFIIILASIPYILPIILIILLITFIIIKVSNKNRKKLMQVRKDNSKTKEAKEQKPDENKVKENSEEKTDKEIKEKTGEKEENQ